METVLKLKSAARRRKKRKKNGLFFYKIYFAAFALFCGQIVL
jgi:hypothetical protein